MRIAINAGHHTEYDPGAVGKNGLREADVNYDIATKLTTILATQKHEVLFIMHNELADICAEANDFNADIFVSIHCNAAKNRLAEGTETYYCQGSEAGERLAEHIQACLIDRLGLVNRGVKTAGYYVLKCTNMPAVLVETAFISNEREEALLADDSRRQAIAEAISQGINEFENC